MLKRNISTAAGVNASVAPAASATLGPDQRRTAAYSSATEATPISACGASIDHELNPKIRPERPMTHSEAGGLSTVIAFEESIEPNSSAFQDRVPACRAAA